MRAVSRVRGWVLMLAGLLLLGVAGSRHATLVEQRHTYHLQAVPPEDTTPMVALTTVAFGGFRGLVADALWIRANKMQEDGEFFELVQLAKWISQLEPRIPEVWSFQAWNLAYNISVLFPDPDDRWSWVNHGIRLLRKEGLTHNPTSATLHWDIGWMYQHKIGMNFDDAHLTYKRKLASDMNALLPGGRLPPSPVPEPLRIELLDQFSLKPRHMAELDARHGPLDWRTPHALSLYWSDRGLEFAEDTFSQRSLQRMRLQSLHAIMRRGNLLVSEESDLWIPLPRFDLIPLVRDEAGTRIDTQPGKEFLQKSYHGFLQDAMLLNLDYGKIEEAREIFQELATRVPEIPNTDEAFESLVRNEINAPPSSLSQDQALSRVVALLRRAMKWEETDVIRARGLTRMAQQMHRMYQESRAGESHLIRTGLPPFEDIQAVLRTAGTSVTDF